MPPILDVSGLTVGFRRPDGSVLSVVDGLDLTLRPGQAVAVVGESGSGKSVSARAMLRLLPPTAVVGGRVLLDGQNVLAMPAAALRRVRGRRIGMVFQNAMEAMNPTLTVGRQLTEHLRWHGVCDRREAWSRAVRALDEVGIDEPERRIRMYPFQLSGGMRQRAMIAMAMVAEPAMLIADEPTTAVDATVQRQILDLLARLRSAGTAIIMITHDLGVARYLCDDVVVMYAGSMLERAPADRFADTPRHPYSQGLIASALDLGSTEPLRPIPGQPPDLAELPVGCVFGPRCAQAEHPGCDRPQRLDRIDTDHLVRCWKVTADG